MSQCACGTSLTVGGSGPCGARVEGGCRRFASLLVVQLKRRGHQRSRRRVAQSRSASCPRMIRPPDRRAASLLVVKCSRSKIPFAAIPGA